MEKKVCCYTRGVRHLFPRDAALQDMLAESYAGVVLWSHTGQPIGLIAIISRRPLADPQLAESMLKLVGVRAAGELERAMTSATIRESEEKFRTLVTSSLDAIVMMDQQGHVMLWNEAAVGIFGYTANEIMGQSIHQCIAGEATQAAFQTAFGQFLESGVCPVLDAHFEASARRKDGTIFPIDISVESLQLQGKWCAAAIIRDITARKQAEEALIQARQTADAANQAKSDFLASMSHELRTPLNGILGFAQILQRTEDVTPKFLSGLHIIENSGNHLLSLINDILDLSKIEAHKVELHPTDTELQSLLQKVTDMVHQRVVQKGLQFQCDFAADLPKMVLVDDKLLCQVLINLLGNAVKFTENGSIFFAVNLQAGKICFSVTDTGIGIPAEKMDIVFEPFSQLHQPGKYEGTGLGLSISQRLVEMMGGRIQVSSEVGKGSCFWFDLALPEVQETAVKIQTKLEVASYKGTRKRILVVDDRVDNRLVLIGLLKPLGFELAEAEDGFLAVALAQQFLPDLILLDLQMPQRNGLETAQAIRHMELAWQPKIVICSATVSEQVTKTCLDQGCDGFLAKPVKLPELLQTLQMHLQLVWNHAETMPEPADSSPGSETSLPHELLEKLLDLINCGDIGAFQELLDRELKTRPPYTTCIQMLKKLGNSFEMKKIQDALIELQASSIM